MADYHAVLKRAIDALPENTGSARRAVYQKARSAIVNQLKSYDPPLSPSEITTEQLRLEEAIRKVEADAARMTLGLGPQPSARSTERPAPAAPPAAASSAAPSSGGSDNGNLSAPPPLPVTPGADVPSDQAKPAASSAPAASPGAQGQSPAAPAPAVQPAAPQPGTPQASSSAPAAQKASVEAPAGDKPSEAAPKGGEPTEPAAKSSGGFFSGLGSRGKDAKADTTGPNGSASDDRREPAMGAGAARPMDVTIGSDDDGLKPQPAPAKEAAVTAAGGAGAKAASAPTRSPALEAAMRGHGIKPDAARSARPSRLPAIAAIVAAIVIFGGLAVGVYSQRDTILSMIEEINAPSKPRETARAPQEPVTPAPSVEDTSGKSSERLLSDESPAAPDARAVTTTRIVPPSSSDAGSTTVTPVPSPADDVRTVEPAQEPRVAAAPEPVETQPAAETPEASASDGAESQVSALPPIPSTPAPSAGNGESLLVAQRSILYEEGDGSDSAGTASQGQVSWTTGRESAPGSEEIDTVLKANVAIPERNISVAVTIRPNRDDALPASHLIEIRFTLPPEFSGKGVANVPGLIMKTTEEARGDALDGASVRVDQGFFWVALSVEEQKRQRNVALLRDRGWIDIPILYENGKRAILTLEKGTPGERAVQVALDAWASNGG